MFVEPCDPTESKAVFMTASEIHAKLKMFGYIDKPMPLNKFGELLKRGGYTPHKVNGKRGYIVKQTDNLSTKQYEERMEILRRAGRAGTS